MLEAKPEAIPELGNLCISLEILGTHFGKSVFTLAKTENLKFVATIDLQLKKLQFLIAFQMKLVTDLIHGWDESQVAF